MMYFASSGFYFAAFALCAVPVIIYLIFRRKRKDVPWGAVYILRRLLETKSKMSAWKQYVIIALRTLALAALAFAFLRPHLGWMAPAGGAFPKPPLATHRFILLDVSSSMDAVSGSGSCMDAALSLCRKALGSAVFPGRIDILPLDGRDEPQVFDSPPIRADQVERFMGELARGAAPTDFEKGLQQAIRTFRASPHEHKELYVLSDFSAADLGSQGRLAGLFRALNRMDVRIYGLSYANDEANNFALHELTPHLDALLAGQPTIFYITVGYYGASATADTWMAIRDQDDNTLFEDTLTLAPGRKPLQVPLSLPPGDCVLTASLKEDDYLPDNRLARSFQVADRLHVVVAQDINLSKGFSNPREWIKLAAGAGTREVSDEIKEMIKRGLALQAQLGKTAPPSDAIDGKQADDGKRYRRANPHADVLAPGNPANHRVDPGPNDHHTHD